MTRVAVTGAGGPSGIAVVRRLAADPGYDVVAGDPDPYAPGLYLVPHDNRWVLPSGDALGFAHHVLNLCKVAEIDVLVPTVDVELLPLCGIRAELAAVGTTLALTGEQALRDCLDKLALVERCAPHLRTPRTEVLGAWLDAASWRYPVIVKPRTGSGSRDVQLLPGPSQLRNLAHDESKIVQEYLPGEEYSVDVLADLDGRVISVVPRARLRISSGVSVAGRTVRDDELDAFARAVFDAVGLTLVANVQCRRDTEGRPALLEVNPRFPGAMPLTVASGVDMPSLCMDALLGRPLPRYVDFRDVIMVRFLDDRFIAPDELAVGP
jgi:carbamoyl-phosphate synthase large subunit